MAENTSHVWALWYETPCLPGVEFLGEKLNDLMYYLIEKFLWQPRDVHLTVLQAKSVELFGLLPSQLFFKDFKHAKDDLVIVSIYWYNRSIVETMKEGRYAMAGSYSLGEHLDRFVKSQVASGLYNNESEVIRDALRQFEIRQLKLQALRDHVKKAIERGGDYADDDIAAILAADAEQ